MFPTGLVTATIMILALSINLAEYFNCMKVKRFYLEKLTETFMIVLLMLGGVVLAWYSKAADEIYGPRFVTAFAYYACQDT